MRRRTWISVGIFFPLAIIMWFLFYKRGENKGPAPTQEQLKVIEIANRELTRLGVAIDEEDVYYDLGNKEWSRELAMYRKEDPDGAKRLDVLDGRDYHTVIYSPRDKLTLGGVFWVFIDRETNEVITLLAEQ